MHNLSFRYTRWLNWPEITDKVCLAYNINSSALKSKLQQRIASEARAATGWLARESGCGEYKFSSAPLIRSHARRA
jgi:hypothetical protein